MEDLLIRKALDAQKNSYSPYSNYKVGAAVEMEDGSIYSGTNIENAAYTPTICAERVAIFKGISEGKKKIKKIAIVGNGDYTFPCGVCRQVMKEFAEDLKVIVAKSINDYEIFELDELLPHGFGPENLKGGGI